MGHGCSHHNNRVVRTLEIIGKKIDSNNSPGGNSVAFL